MSEQTVKPKIGISVGDLNGIGMEVIMKTLSNPEIMELCTPIVYASSKVASYHRKALEMPDFSFHVVNNMEQLHDSKPNLFQCWKEDVNLELGKESKEVGAFALKSLDHTCRAVEAGEVDAMVTAPIHKKTIQSKDFQFSGHTDYLEARFKSKAIMMMVSDDMRMALATVHVPLSKVTEMVTEDLVLERIKTLHQSLKNDFLISKPRIAVLALNPHAGDGGVMGNEDETIVAKAIKQAFDSGSMAFGPYPADSFFGSGEYKKFDGILAMYHDQGLIPFKSLSFGRGVNYSAGLPFIRTSPDHGTAFGIAGQGVADEGSFREALLLAADLVKKRAISAEINANPLKIKKSDKER